MTSKTPTHSSCLTMTSSINMAFNASISSSTLKNKKISLIRVHCLHPPLTIISLLRENQTNVDYFQEVDNRKTYLSSILIDIISNRYDFGLNNYFKI